MIEASSSVLPFNLLTRLGGARPLIVYYHTVSEQPLPHVTPLYRHKAPREFEADLEWLLRRLPAVDLATVLRAARGEPCPRGFFITFDDGLREVAEIAAPILRRKGVPAALFINPPFLDNSGMFYRFKAALVIGCLPSVSAVTRAEIGRRLGQPDHSVAALSAAVLAIGYTRRAVLDELASLGEVDFGEFLRKQRPYMTVHDARALQRGGWALGAHSLDHPLYAEIPHEEQLRQTRESLRVVDEVFAPAHRLFAFPFTAGGVGDGFYRETLDTLKIDACFGTGGWFHEPERRLLHRVSLEGEKPPVGQFLKQSLGSAWARSAWQRIY